MPKALITGVTGQDGSYLAEFLLDLGYDVIGMVRRTSTVNFTRIQHIQDRITLVSGDLLDQGSLIGILRDHRPTEIYNLAAQSFVPTSWGQPVFTGEVLRLGRDACAGGNSGRRSRDPFLPGLQQRDVSGRCGRYRRAKILPSILVRRTG